MLTLTKLEKEYQRLITILQKAQKSNSLEDKRQALVEFENSELNKKHDSESLRCLLMNEGATKSTIDIYNSLIYDLPDLKNKAASLELELKKLDANKNIARISPLNTSNELAKSKENINLDKGDLLKTIALESSVSNLITNNEIKKSYRLSQNPTKELKTEGIQQTEKKLMCRPKIEVTSKKNILADKLQTMLDSYIETTKKRTEEYNYGLVGKFFSYFNMAGDSKTEKLDVINKLFNYLKNENNKLSQDDARKLTTGTLGDIINELLNDDDLGEILRSALDIKTLKPK